MDTGEAIYVFCIGVLFGLYLSDVLGRMEYRSYVRDIPEFLNEKGDKE